MSDPRRSQPPCTEELHPSWRELVRSRMPELHLPPEREAEVVEELAQWLADASSHLEFHRQEEVDAFLQQQIPTWNDIESSLSRDRRPPRPIPGLENRSSSFTAGVFSDLRQAARMLAQRPGFTAIAVLAIGLGIGIASSVFSLVDYVLFRPLPVEQPRELVNIYASSPGGFLSEEPMAYPDFVDLQKMSRTLQEITASAMAMVAVEQGDEARIEIGTLATGNFFETFGIKAAAGRLLMPEDDQMGNPAAVAVLGHRAWKEMFDASPEAIGATLRVNGHALTIIGALPEKFTGLWPAVEPTLWLPMSLQPVLGASGTTNFGSPSESPLESRGSRWLWVVGRRASEASLAQTQDELTRLAANLSEAYTETNGDRRFVALPTREVRLIPGIDAGLKTASAVVMALVGLILLIVCANVGNMLLARALSRRREMATRLSLGAGRGRILRQLLVEGSLLALLGAAVGVSAAVFSNILLNRVELPIPIPLSLDLAIDWRVLLFTAGLAGFTAVVSSLAPAAETLRTNLITSLRDGGRISGNRSQRWQSGLVLAQVCLSVVLLVCAGLSARSLLNAQNIDLGFEPHGVVTASLAPGLQGYDEEESLAFYQRLQDDLSARPEVARVAYASHLPLSFWVNTAQVAPERDRHLPEEERNEVDMASAGAGYFEAMGIEILRGRSFETRDRDSSVEVAVVNETLARSFWPTGDAVGRRLVFGERSLEVVGVAQNGKYRTLGEKPRPFLYLALDQDEVESLLFLTVRFQNPELASPEVLRQTIRHHAPHLAESSLGTLEEAISPAMILPLLSGRLFGLLGALGLFLAAIGLYGVLAYAVARRTHEIGVRRAMGAQRHHVLSLVMRQGLGLTAVGVLLGAALAAALTRMLQSILYGISATDPWTFAAVVGVLFLVAALACCLPARRALRIDPLAALRHE
ncbi:MAG: ABC transporter permease [Deltaproteobacteria bacterium]|nr:ABC transporter permease [Deltaproteobacteria bacterium]